MQSNGPLLERRGLTAFYGDFQALFGIDIRIEPLWGTLAGGVVLGVAQTLGARINPGYQILAGHLVFLAILTVRPQGLFAKIR